MLKNYTWLASSLLSGLSKTSISPVICQASFSQFCTMKIGTHDGAFHCDEALACFMLKKLPQYKDADIIRTRDMAKLSECDIVVDVGAVFDHQKKRYDHHQRGFTETLSSLRPELEDKYTIKLSSAGLIYAYYGEDIIREITPKDSTLPPDDVKIVYRKIYQNLIEEVDGIDNGVPMTEEEPKYTIHTNLSSRVRRLNPVWNAKDVNQNEQFKKAVDLVGEEFMYIFNYITTVWLPARSVVRTAIENRFNIHSSGEIIELADFCPWQEHLFDLEKEMEIGDHLKYVLFSNDTNWRVQGVPIFPSSFVLRKPLNKNWWGITDEDLSKVSGIPGCIFCHSTGFIGGNKTRSGALQMAIASLEA